MKISQISQKQVDRAKRAISCIMTNMCFVGTMKMTNKGGIATDLFRSKIFTMFDMMETDPIGFDLIMQKYMSPKMDNEIEFDKEILEEVKKIKTNFSKKGAK